MMRYNTNSKEAKLCELANSLIFYYTTCSILKKQGKLICDKI